MFKLLIILLFLINWQGLFGKSDYCEKANKDLEKLHVDQLKMTEEDADDCDWDDKTDPTNYECRSFIQLQVQYNDTRAKINILTGVKEMRDQFLRNLELQNDNARRGSKEIVHEVDTIIKSAGKINRLRDVIKAEHFDRYKTLAKQAIKKGNKPSSFSSEFQINDEAICESAPRKSLCNVTSDELTMIDNFGMHFIQTDSKTKSTDFTKALRGGVEEIDIKELKEYKILLHECLADDICNNEPTKTTLRKYYKTWKNENQKSKLAFYTKRFKKDDKVKSNPEIKKINKEFRDNLDIAKQDIFSLEEKIKSKFGFDVPVSLKSALTHIDNLENEYEDLYKNGLNRYKETFSVLKKTQKKHMDSLNVVAQKTGFLNKDVFNDYKKTLSKSKDNYFEKTSELLRNHDICPGVQATHDSINSCIFRSSGFKDDDLEDKIDELQDQLEEIDETMIDISEKDVFRKKDREKELILETCHANRDYIKHESLACPNKFSAGAIFKDLQVIKDAALVLTTIYTKKEEERKRISTRGDRERACGKHMTNSSFCENIMKTKDKTDRLISIREKYHPIYKRDDDDNLVATGESAPNKSVLAQGIMGGILTFLQGGQFASAQMQEGLMYANMGIMDAHNQMYWKQQQEYMTYWNYKRMTNDPTEEFYYDATQYLPYDQAADGVGYMFG